jgi:hypothetical protein
MWEWALYPTAFAAEAHCWAKLTVFCPDPTLRGRYRKMLPRIEPHPALIEPDQLELISDDERARREPHQTILAAIYHARESCDDLPTLEAWYARARTCDPDTPVDDLLA